MAAEVKMVSKNPAFSPEAMDEPIEPPPFALSSKGVANPAYENCPTDKTDPSHHYENPGNIAQGRSQRQKTNALYESVPPQQTSKKYQENEPGFYSSAKRDARLNCIILFVILIISILALLLVIFIILGKLGPSCSCTSKSTVTSPNVGAQTSVNPLYDEMAELRKNLSTLSTRMKQDVAALQNKLNTAEQEIELLKTNASKTTLNLQQQFTAVNSKAIENKNDITSLKNDLNTAWVQANTTRDNLEAHINDYNALKAQLENYTTVLRTADQSLTTFVYNINDTLTAKIDAVSKMPGPPGPQGPPGVNGTQGIQGTSGLNGNPGSPGAPGVNGSAGPKGDPGATGVQGARGFNGSTGSIGPKGDKGAGNLTQCVVIRKASTAISANTAASISVSVTEETEKKILHYSCSSNIADTIEQVQGVSGGKNAYSCTCTGRGSYTGFTGSFMYCYITYTECPLIS